MNKSKLRERLKKDLDIFIDSVEQEMQTDEVFLTEGYWFYDDLLNFAEKLVAKNRKAILEEVRKIVGEESIELVPSIKNINENGNIDFKFGFKEKVSDQGIEKISIRNQLRTEILQKLSLLEGK